MSDSLAACAVNDGTSRAIATGIILREQRQLACVLILLERLVGAIAIGKNDVDVSLLASVLCYINDYPERLHHPKEDRYLCALLRARCPQSVELLERVDVEHRISRRMLVAIVRCLVSYQAHLPDSTADLVLGCSAYVKFQLDHIALESGLLLPMAGQWLIADDWNEVAEAFGANADPLAAQGNGHPAYQRLIDEIADLLPLSHGTLLQHANASLGALQYLDA